jgi:type II secretory ATPase GspE/PulE/Tfp pilus assembly ATPase PilB-like protein
MTQAHFIPQITNPADLEQQADQFFKEYRQFLEEWPWQSSAKDWLDYILSFATQPHTTSVFLDPQFQTGAKLYLRVDGAVLPGPTFTKKQYKQLLAAIDHCFYCSKTIGETYLNEGFLLAETGQRHWVGFLPTIVGTQVTVLFERKRPIEPLQGWPAQAKTVLEQMLNHPNGLMLFCHRGWSLSQQDTIFAALDSLLARGKPFATRIGFISESLQTLPQYENMTQLCVDGSPAAWEQATRTLVAQDTDVVVMRGRNEKEVVTQAVLTALEDRTVMVDVSHFGIIETLYWLLTELPISPGQMASVLLGIVGSYPSLRQVCPHCKTEQIPEPELLQLLNQHHITPAPNSYWVEGQGCPQCHGSGHMSRERLTVAEAAYIDSSLAKLCAERPSKAQLAAALAEQGFQTYLEQAVAFAQQGQTTLYEARRVGLARRADL